MGGILSKIVGDDAPIRKALGAEVNVFPLESVNSVLGSVIHKEIANVEVFVMTQDEALVQRVGRDSGNFRQKVA